MTLITGFNTKDPNTGNSQELGTRYITKDYLLDVYPNVATLAGTRTAPGLYVWGNGLNNNLGFGTTTSYSSPVQLGALSNWKQISVNGPTVAAIKTDGTLWAWGDNTLGRLGDGTILAKSSPIQIGLLTNWKQVSVGSQCTVAVKNDGTLWVWGGNSFGNLGIANTSPRSSPVQVGALTNWKQVNACYNQWYAVKTDGSLWGCGYNGAATPLGDSTFVTRSSPMQIGLLRNWKTVNSTYSGLMAIKNDGTLWVAGQNDKGQLGLGDLVNRSSPVQVGSLTNWKTIASGGSTWIGVKTDGTLWGCGYGVAGVLGDGTVTSKSSPIQIGLLTNWKTPIPQNTGASIFGAIKTDGTLWVWGLGTSTGDLGLGDISINRSSPVQIGNLTTWKSGSYGSAGNFLIADGYI